MTGLSPCTGNSRAPRGSSTTTTAPLELGAGPRPTTAPMADAAAAGAAVVAVDPLLDGRLVGFEHPVAIVEAIVTVAARVRFRGIRSIVPAALQLAGRRPAASASNY